MCVCVCGLGGMYGFSFLWVLIGAGINSVCGFAVCMHGKDVRILRLCTFWGGMSALGGKLALVAMGLVGIVGCSAYS